MVFFGKISAVVFYIDIPVAVFYENSNIFVAQIPSYIVVIPLVLGGFNRQGKIPAAQPRTLVTQNLFSH